MNRVKALFRSRGVACSGRDVYYARNRSLWAGKLTEEGLRLRPEFLYKQLDHLRLLSRDAKRAMLTEARRHSGFKKLCGVPGLGPVRVAQVIAQVGSPDRFQGRRQLFAYCGLWVVRRTSSGYEFEGGRVRTRRGAAHTRGLTRGYSRRLKRVLKAAAIESQKDEQIKSNYRSQIGRGVRAEMARLTIARLTIARELAAVTLRVWKEGAEYDPGRLTKRAA